MDFRVWELCGRRDWLGAGNGTVRNPSEAWGTGGDDTILFPRVLVSLGYLGSPIAEERGRSTAWTGTCAIVP
jgi:hypothetical protein